MANEKSAATVTVACKLPHGLILRIFDMKETQEPVMGGGYRATKTAQEREQRITVFGVAHPQNAAPKCEIVAGYAITHDVPKDFWNLWLQQNKESAVVKNNLIFAHDTIESTKAEAKEKIAVRSGLERLDPEKLPKGLERDKDVMKAAA